MQYTNNTMIMTAITETLTPNVNYKSYQIRYKKELKTIIRIHLIEINEIILFLYYAKC